MDFIQNGGYRKIRISFVNETKQEKDKKVLTELLKHCSPVVNKESVEQRAEAMMETLDLRLNQEAKSLEEYCLKTRTSTAEIMDELRSHARRQLSERAIIEEIADKEKITASEKDFDNQLDNMLKIYPLEKSELLKALGDSGQKKIREDLRIRKTLDFLISVSEKGESV